MNFWNWDCSEFDCRNPRLGFDKYDNLDDAVSIFVNATNANLFIMGVIMVIFEHSSIKVYYESYLKKHLINDIVFYKYKSIIASVFIHKWN